MTSFKYSVLHEVNCYEKIVRTLINQNHKQEKFHSIYFKNIIKKKNLIKGIELIPLFLERLSLFLFFRFKILAFFNIQQLMFSDFTNNLILISKFQMFTVIANHIINTKSRLHCQIHYAECFTLFSRSRCPHSKGGFCKFLIHPF